MTAGGYFVVWRQMQDNSWLWGNLDRRNLWFWLLHMASFSSRAVEFDGIEVVLGAGELVTSYRLIAADNGLQPRRAAKLIDGFAEQGMLSRRRIGKGRRGGTVITLANWEKYQKSGQSNGIQKAGETPRHDWAGGEVGQAKGSQPCHRNNKDNKGNINTGDSPAEIASLIQRSFSHWYQDYPCKKSKAQAIKAWEKICKSLTRDQILELTNTISDDIADKSASIERGEDDHFGFSRLHPTTYLNNRRWEDGQ